MFNRLIKIVAALFIVSCFGISSAYSADVAKIGVFDYQRFLGNSKAGQKIRQALNTKRNEYESKLKDKREELKKIREQLEREAVVMSPEKQEEKKREYRIKVNDYNELDSRYTKDIKQTEFTESKKLFTQLKEILTKLGKDENYLMIVHETAVLYAPDQIDITDQVIKTHNNKFGTNE